MSANLEALEVMSSRRHIRLSTLIFPAQVVRGTYRGGHFAQIPRWVWSKLLCKRIPPPLNVGVQTGFSKTHPPFYSPRLVLRNHGPNPSTSNAAPSLQPIDGGGSRSG
jgi:hypothetical protein